MLPDWERSLMRLRAAGEKLVKVSVGGLHLMSVPGAGGRGGGDPCLVPCFVGLLL